WWPEQQYSIGELIQALLLVHGVLDADSMRGDVEYLWTCNAQPLRQPALTPPSCTAEAISTPARPASLHSLRPWRPRTPPPVKNKALGNAAIRRRQSPSVPGPSFTPTRAISRTITLRMPSEMTCRAMAAASPSHKS